MSKTILILDDDALIRASLTPSFEAVGFRVVGAATGAAAEQSVSRDHPDAVIVDGLLPDTSGVAWIEKQRRGGNQVPMYFISAFWKDANTAKKLTEQLGVRGVFPKPVDPGALARLAAEAVGLIGAGGEPEEEIEELDIEVGSDVGLEDPRERSTLRMDAARTLSQKIRDLSDAFRRAHQRLDPMQLADARQIAEKLEQLAQACGFTDVARSTGRLAAALKLLGSSSVVKKEAWIPVAQQFETALQLAREAAQVDRHALKPTPRLLVVDPDAAALKHLRSLLPRSFCLVTTETAVDAAIERAGRERPDAVLVNLKLGEALGLAEQLRALAPERPLASGFISDREGGGELVRQARAAGAKALLTKPFARDAVIEQVCQLIGADTAPPRPRLAVIDRDPEVIEEIGFWAARSGMDAKVIGRGATVEHLLRVHPDALVVDVSDEAGLTLAREARRLGRFRDLPIIALTRTGAKGRIAAIEAGVDAALEAPPDFDELFTLLKARLDAARSLFERSARDPVTGLANRTGFLEALSQRLADLRRGKRPLALLLVRLANGKALQDALGPAGYDELFAASAKALEKQFRVEDLRARWDEHTFALGLMGAAPSHLLPLIEKLTTKLVGATPGLSQAPRWATGVANFPDEGFAIVELLQLSERRLEG